MKKLIIISLIAIASAACGGSETPTKNAVEAPNAQPSNALPATETAESEKAKEEVVSSTRKLKDLKFWTAKTEIENLPALSGEIRFVAPDRYQFKQGTNEAIVIGEQTYTKENGKWQKSEFDMTGLLKIRENALSEEDVKKIKNVQVIASETLNGRKATVYAHSVINGSVETATKMWIDDETKIVMKTVVENRAGKQTQRIITTYDFETPVSIEAPKIGAN